jgi:hypothetical protein
MGTAPPLGNCESSMAYALLIALVLCDLLQCRGNLAINRKTRFDPGHGVLAPTPTNRGGKGKDHQSPERDAFRFGSRKASRHETVNQLRHDSGIREFE